MNVIIDRFEGDFAVVELDGREFSKIPKELIPKDARKVQVNNFKKGRNRKKERRNTRLFNDVWNNE